VESKRIMRVIAMGIGNRGMLRVVLRCGGGAEWPPVDTEIEMTEEEANEFRVGGEVEVCTTVTKR